LDVNVLGFVQALHALAPEMVERGEGAIVATCSVNSFLVEDLLSAYSSSKAALLHVVRSAALELGSADQRGLPRDRRHAASPPPLRVAAGPRRRAAGGGGPHAGGPAPGPARGGRSSLLPRLRPRFRDVRSRRRRRRRPDDD